MQVFEFELKSEMISLMHLIPDRSVTQQMSLKLLNLYDHLQIQFDNVDFELLVETQSIINLNFNAQMKKIKRYLPMSRTAKFLFTYLSGQKHTVFCFFISTD